jgi:phospholipid/cholesterol/gamma-HCH transport system substrate-binding protein
MSRYRIGPNATRVVAVTALVIIFMITLLLLAASRDTYEMRAVFDDVRGLIPGGDVTAGAIVVGSVTEVELNEDGDPEVTMAIEDEFKLHEGAFANIRLASNVGAVNRVVDLQQGDLTAPELPEGTTLRDEATDNPVDFDLAVSTLQPEVRDDLRRVLAGLDAALKGRGGDFDRMLQHSGIALSETGRLLAEVNRDGEALRTLVRDGGRVVHALASSPGDLGEAAERTATMLDVTARRQAELAESVQHLGPALASGRQLLDRLASATPNARQLVAGLDPLVDELGPFARLLPAATEAAGPFFDETEKLVSESPAALRKTRKLVSPETRRVLRKFGPLTQRLLPVVESLRVFTPEQVGFFQNGADAAANYDANGHMIRIAAGGANMMPMSIDNRPGDPYLNPVAPGECGTGLLAEPFHRLPGVLECEPWPDYEDSFLGDGG